MSNEPSIALIIPCHNEAATIDKVIDDFRRQLPQAAVYVYDNNSTDETRAVANQSGATVRTESIQGKGNVVRRMFADVEADIYVLVDGDGTYDATSVLPMIQAIKEEHLDMVVGVRDESIAEKSAYPIGHAWGNIFFNMVFNILFKGIFTDIFSGYRVFSRRFVKSFPALTTGFEIETEISIHAVELKLPTKEVKTAYYRRHEGSQSKLNTFRDGFRILFTIIRLYKEVFPFRFFCGIASVLALCSFYLGIPLLSTWLETGLVPRFPTAILASGIMVLAAISLTCGLILDNVTRGRLEQKRLRYLGLSSSSFPDNNQSHAKNS